MTGPKDPKKEKKQPSREEEAKQPRKSDMPESPDYRPEEREKEGPMR